MNQLQNVIKSLTLAGLKGGSNCITFTTTGDFDVFFILMSMNAAIFSARNKLFGNTKYAINAIFFLHCLFEPVSLN